MESDRRGDDGRRFIVHAEEKLTAFVELESAISRYHLLAAWELYNFRFEFGLIADYLAAGLNIMSHSQ